MARRRSQSDMDFGAVGMFGSTTRNTCTSQDDGLYCKISRVLGTVGTVLGIVLMFAVIYMLVMRR